MSIALQQSKQLPQFTGKWEEWLENSLLLRHVLQRWREEGTEERHSKRGNEGWRVDGLFGADIYMPLVFFPSVNTTQTYSNHTSIRSSNGIITIITATAINNNSSSSLFYVMRYPLPHLHQTGKQCHDIFLCSEPNSRCA